MQPAYRIAPTLYESTLPDLRFVSIGDVSPELGSLAARRFGYERTDTSWQAIAEDPDINVVSVVVANTLHREIVEGLVAAGKHVLCEKPLSDNLEDARAMADIARSADTVVRIGFTLRRAPGVAALRELVTSGALGRVLHVDGRYWCDYASDPQGHRSAGGTRELPGSGALADIGSHVAYLVEFLGGDVQEVSGGRFATAITERPVPLGTVVGHGASRGERHLRSRSRTTTTPASAPDSSKASVSCRSPASPPATRMASRSRSSGTRAPRSGSRSVQRSSSSC